jgi:hypothetical protein
MFAQVSEQNKLAKPRVDDQIDYLPLVVSARNRPLFRAGYLMIVCAAVQLGIWTRFELFLLIGG